MEADRNSRRDADGPVVGLTGARFGGTAGRRSRKAAESPAENPAVENPAVEAPVVEIHCHRGDRPVVGQTGARFASSRWRRKQPDSAPQQMDTTGAQQPTSQQPPSQQPPSQQQAGPQPEAAPPVHAPDKVNEAAWDMPEESYGLARPYTWTGGRTASRVDLAVETLVSATGRPVDPAARPEHRMILGRCATPRSVAELAALLSMPLGVARVLLGDLAAAGNVAVHRTVGSADAAPDAALMERVLSGLQRL